jgi:hypothetical protein
VAVILAGWSILLSAPASSAQPPSTCIDFRDNVEGTDASQQGNHQGIFTTMAFFGGSNDCIRVSSIAVRNGTGEVELGWVLGYHPSNNNPYSGPGACAGQYFANPQVFEVWTPIGGGYHCRNLGQESTGLHNVKLYDNNSDTVWSMAEGGSILDAVNVNFDHGLAVTNGERHNSSDTSRAHFTDLQKQISGDTTWYPFTISVEEYDSDSSFHWHKDSQTETWVLPD